VPLHCRPHEFLGIELRRIGGEPYDREPSPILCDERPDKHRLVCRQSIPEENEVASAVPPFETEQDGKDALLAHRLLGHPGESVRALGMRVPEHHA